MPHIHHLYDFTITAFITHQDKVLFVHHPRYGKWIAPGGHIELNEDPEQALIREIEEETGLKTEIISTRPSIPGANRKLLPTPEFMDVHDANAPHKHISFVYFAKSLSDAFVLSDEHLAMKWFSHDDLSNKEYALDPVDIFYARKAIEKSHQSSSS